MAPAQTVTELLCGPDTGRDHRRELLLVEPERWPTHAHAGDHIAVCVADGCRYRSQSLFKFIHRDGIASGAHLVEFGTLG